MIRIIHAERYELFKDGLKHALDKCNDIRVIDEAESFDNLFIKLNIHTPDVLIISHMLRDGFTCEYVEFINDKYPSIRIIVLTMAFTEEVMLSLLPYVHGFVGKNASAAEILYAIRKVYRGETHFTLPSWSRTR